MNFPRKMKSGLRASLPGQVFSSDAIALVDSEQLDGT